MYTIIWCHLSKILSLGKFPIGDRKFSNVITYVAYYKIESDFSNTDSELDKTSFNRIKVS